MTGNKIALDTNIIAALLKGERIIADKIDAAEEVYIPINVLGELYYGAEYSTNVEANIQNIDKLLARYEVLNTNEQTGVLYGSIKASLRKKGKPIPENDIWIATIAKQNNLILATRDKHFAEVEGLETENW
jgi:tRNA(fMet)-specific endonuclease VapC